MIDFAYGLRAEDLTALADLERRCVDADGGRLKLEWGMLRARSGNQADDLLWHEDGLLRGFLGLYAVGPWVELAGMVDPAARGAGIGSALLDAGLRLCHERGFDSALLIVPRGSAGGAVLAAGRDGVLDHSEHAMVQPNPGPAGPSDPSLQLRPAQPSGDDCYAVGRLMERGFGMDPADVAELLASDRGRTLLVERDGVPLASLRLSRDANTGAIHGFVVDPDHQGQGIGRDVLRRACDLLRAEGAELVRLEVEVSNDRALGLYESVGFSVLTTEDYYRLPTRVLSPTAQ